MTAWTAEQVALAKESECWQSDPWTVHAILHSEILTPRVVDPCCGDGIMSKIAKEHGHKVHAFDKHDWGHGECEVDYLQGTPARIEKLVADATIFANPPFSKARDFVERSMQLNARKIVCFQRFSWWESGGRLEWWGERPPNRIYVCADRATCWLITVPPEERVDANGRPKSTPTAHAYFVLDRNQPNGTLIGHISKDRSV